MIDALRDFTKKYLVRELSVSFTRKTDDITTADKPPMTPYVSREGYFDSDGFEAMTGSRLKVFRRDGGYRISLCCGREQSRFVSEYGLNIPINFMGKKNAGGWRNQYLFNSPYATDENDHIFCWLSSPGRPGLLILSLGKIDGWKLDYSLFSGGQYFDSLKFLASFDRAYGGSGRRRLELFVCEAADYREALRIVSDRLRLPVAYYGQSGVRIGEKLRIYVCGDFDYLKSDDGSEAYLNEGGYAEIVPKNQGLLTVTPYRNGKRGLACVIYVYDSVKELYRRSVFGVSREDLARTDGNMCESKNHLSAMLRWMIGNGKDKRLLDIVMPELELLTTDDISQAKDRQTIFPRAHDGYPAYNTLHSNRVQEQFFGVGILLDAYKLTQNEFWLNFAKHALDSVLDHHQRDDGRIETTLEWSVRPEDYTTVCCLIIPVTDMAIFLRERDPVRSEKYFTAAGKMAEHVYERGFLFPTETLEQDEAEPFVEEGSISCSALTLLYYCAKVRRIPKYIKRAKAFLDLHDSWVIHTNIAPMFYSSLRWWETKFEADYDGNALCCGHAWTIWRAEADFWYYKLTGDKTYLDKARNGFMSNFSKINEKGQSYSCYQPDYITGGGFTTNGRQVDFRIARGFPRHTDSSLSRYVWVRAHEILEELFPEA